MNSLVKEDPTHTLDAPSLISRDFVPRLRADDANGLAHKPKGLDRSTAKRQVLPELSPSVVEQTQTVLDYGSSEPSVPETEVGGYACPLLASLLGSPHIHEGAAISPKFANIKVEVDDPCDSYMTIKKEGDDEDPRIPVPSEEKFPPLAYDSPKRQPSIEPFSAGPEPNVSANHDAFGCEAPMSNPLLPGVVEQEQSDIPSSLPFEQYPTEQPPAYLYPSEQLLIENYHAARSYAQTLTLARRLALARQMGRIYRHVSFGRRAPDHRFSDPLFGRVAPRPLSKSLHGVPLQSASHTGGHHLAFDPPGAGSFPHPNSNYGNQNAQGMSYAQGGQAFSGYTGSDGSATGALDTELLGDIQTLWALVSIGSLNVNHLLDSASIVAYRWFFGFPPPDPSPPYPIAHSPNLYAQSYAPYPLFQPQPSHYMPFPNPTLPAGPDNSAFGPGSSGTPNLESEQTSPPEDPTATVAHGATPLQTHAPSADEASHTFSIVMFSPIDDNTEAAEDWTGEAALEPGQKACPKCPKVFSRPSLLKAHMHRHGWGKQHKCVGCGKLYAYLSGLDRHMNSTRCRETRGRRGGGRG